jgi:hypothetical protein
MIAGRVGWSTFVALVGVLGAVALDAHARAGAPKGSRSDQPPPVASTSIEKLGAEFRHLRALEKDPKERERHFVELEYWGGRMQEVMNELGRRLGVGGTPRRLLAEVMGKPDAVAHRGDPDWRFAGRRDSTEILLYWWRHHDLLYFEIHGDAIVRSDWWMPYE